MPTTSRRTVSRRAQCLADRATARQVEVLAAYVATGSEKAAAHRLGVAPATVKHTLANTRSKFGVETTTQLVLILAPRLPEPQV